MLQGIGVQLCLFAEIGKHDARKVGMEGVIQAVFCYRSHQSAKSKTVGSGADVFEQYTDLHYTHRYRYEKLRNRR
jgi:hypothetical protein